MDGFFPHSALALQNFVLPNSASAWHKVKILAAFPHSALALQNFPEALQNFLNALWKFVACNTCFCAKCQRNEGVRVEKMEKCQLKGEKGVLFGRWGHGKTRW